MTPTQTLEFVRARCREDGGCWIWLGCVQHCGTTPTVRIPGTRKTTSVRRMVLQAVGVDLRGKVATYSCESPLCVTPEHQIAVTRPQLQQRTGSNLPLSSRIARGTRLAKLKRARAKLSEEILELVRQSPMPHRDIARFLGVNRDTLRQALNGRTWAPLPGSNPFATLMRGLS